MRVVYLEGDTLTLSVHLKSGLTRGREVPYKRETIFVEVNNLNHLYVLSFLYFELDVEADNMEE
jgi:hypothetical protein